MGIHNRMEAHELNAPNRLTDAQDAAMAEAYETRTIARLVFGESGNTTLDTISRDLHYKLYEHFVDAMPYGVAKGRTGTFDEWFYDHIDEVQREFQHIEHLNDDREVG